MMKQIETQYEVGTEISFGESEQESGMLQGILQATKMQTTMFVYDALHHTNYREVRNNLVREKRNRDFEARIGLVAVDNKKGR